LEEQLCGFDQGVFMSDSAQDAQTLQERVEGVIGEIRPVLQADGGDIELVSVDADSGVVSVQLQGACKGCPGAAMTLKMGVERHLREKVPEVKEVVAVQ
jgi:Fe-S cluster biogenesis protein NfuA